MSRGALLAAAAALVLGLSACADDGGDPGHALGTVENPIVAPSVDAATAVAATRKGHLNEARPAQTQGQQPWSEAQTGQSPCDLVSPADAQAILKASIRKPVVAPQGPTCVYRARKGTAFVTLSVQPLNRQQLKQQVRTLKKIDVSGRTGYCARSEQSTLYVQVAGERLLTVGGPCRTAKAFAVKALPELSS